MKRCFIRTAPSVYHINEVCCISANLTTAHDRETSCLPWCSKEQQRWKSGRENKNKSECAGLLIERSALFMSGLASVLPMTFDYCGVKRTSTEFDLCIISVQPCVWISHHTRAPLMACVRPCWMKALWGFVCTDIALLSLLILICFLFIRLAFRFFSSVALISSGYRHLAFTTIYSQLKWFSCVHVSVCMWPWPDTKEWMSTARRH